MRSAAYHPASDWDRRSIGRRATALLLAVVVHVLLLLMLLTLAPRQLRRDLPIPDKVFQLIQVAGTARQKQPAGSAASRVKRASGGAPRAPTPRLPRAKPPPPVPTALNIVHLSREDLAAGDIGALPSHAPAAAGAGSGAAGIGSGRSAGADDGAGEGPGGEKLYNAEWFVRPTDAEMATYLPKSLSESGWGEIACRTVANYRVEDCVELGQSPPASGLARAVRLASWQFKVLPPRIGPRRLVGAWVRIHYEITLRRKDE